MALNPITVTELQISAVADNGSPEGVIKTAISAGKLVKVPFTKNAFYNASAGSGNVSFVTGAYMNSDGTNTALQLSTGAAGLGSNMGAVQVEFFGTKIGLSFYFFNTVSPEAKFSAIIDGIAYDFDFFKSLNFIDNVQQSASFAQNEIKWLIADNLPNTRHTLTILLYPSVTLSKTLFLHHMLLDSAAGYEPKKRLDFTYANGSLTASAVNVPDSVTDPLFGSLIFYVYGLKAIDYYNGDTVSRTVTIMINATIIKQFTLAVGASARFDTTQLGITVVNSTQSGTANTLRHYVDAITTTAVSFVCYGSN